MTDTATTVEVEEFDPLDDPEVATFYNRLKQQRGQVAADRYLLTVKPTKGMTATSSTVVTYDRSQAQKRAAPQLEVTLPSSLALHGSDTIGSALLTPDEPTEGTETTASVVRPEAPPLVTEPTPELMASTDAQVNVSPKVTASVQAQALKASGPVAVVTETPKRERKPARSTAEVKQAFEDALATFIKADQPFKRSHVVKAAGLGASFYGTYPLLRKQVDAAIAQVGKPKLSTPQPQGAVETMTSEANALSPVAPETPVGEEAVEPETALTTGTRNTSDNTALSHSHSTVTGLTWVNMAAQADNWRDEEARLKQQMSQLLDQLDIAVENAAAYERVLRLHTPQEGAKHEH